MRLREAKHRHDGVPDELFQDAAVFAHGLARDVVIAAQQDAGILGIEALADRCRTDNVGEKDDDDATLFSQSPYFAPRRRPTGGRWPN